MKTASIFSMAAVGVLAAMALACLNLYSGDGFFVAGAGDVDAARGGACLLTIL